MRQACQKHDGRECLANVHFTHRSVTFLKRKGGLFKKAHELSVLCSVDVAVIIFGHNKKLYEYSSGDINETIGRFQYVCARKMPCGTLQH